MEPIIADTRAEWNRTISLQIRTDFADVRSRQLARFSCWTKNWYFCL